MNKSWLTVVDVSNSKVNPIITCLVEHVGIYIDFTLADCVRALQSGYTIERVTLGTDNVSVDGRLFDMPKVTRKDIHPTVDIESIKNVRRLNCFNEKEFAGLNLSSIAKEMLYPESAVIVIDGEKYYPKDIYSNANLCDIDGVKYLDLMNPKKAS